MENIFCWVVWLSSSIVKPCHCFLSEGALALELCEQDEDVGRAMQMLYNDDEAFNCTDMPMALSLYDDSEVIWNRDSEPTNSAHPHDEQRRKRVGRPRVQQAVSTNPKEPTGGGELNITESHDNKRKSRRGPKPKYRYSNSQEALDARRERNRQAAMNSYYRKREKLEALEAEVRRLEEENEALRKLEQGLKDGNIREAIVSNECIDEWLLMNRKN